MVPVQTTPSVTEVGKVMAGLEDFKLIIFVLLVLIFIMVAERAAAAFGMRAERRDMRAERERMWAVADKFGEAATAIGEQTDKLVVELQVLRTLAARVESRATANDGSH